MNKSLILKLGLGALLVAGSAGLLFWNFKAVPLAINGDEAYNGVDAISALDTGNYKVFYSDGYGREGLLVNLEAKAIGEWGTDPWVLRIPSMVFGLLSVIGTYLVSLELLEREKSKYKELAAFAAASLYATSFWLLALSRIAFSGTEATACAAFAGFFLLLRRRTGNELYSVLAGLTAGLGLYTYIPFRFFLLALLPLVIPLRKKAAWFVVPFLVSGWAMIWAFVTHPEYLGQRTSVVSATGTLSERLPKYSGALESFANMFAVRGDPTWLQNIPDRPLLGIVLTAMAVAGYFLLARKDKNVLAFVTLWIGVGAATQVLTGLPTPYFLRFLISTPALFALIALSLYKSLEWMNKRGVPMKLLVACIAVIIIGRYAAVSYDYFHVWANSPELGTEPNVYNPLHWGQANQILEASKAGTVYVVSGEQPVNGDPFPPVDYYVLYRIGAYDRASALKKNVIFVNADVPAEVNSIPQGADTVYI